MGVYSSARSVSYGLRNLSLEERGCFGLEENEKAPIIALIARRGEDGESYPDPLPVKLLSDGACQVETGLVVRASFSKAAAERSVGERAQGSVLSR